MIAYPTDSGLWAWERHGSVRGNCPTALEAMEAADKAMEARDDRD